MSCELMAITAADVTVHYLGGLYVSEARGGTNLGTVYALVSHFYIVLNMPHYQDDLRLP